MRFQFHLTTRIFREGRAAKGVIDGRFELCRFDHSRRKMRKPLFRYGSAVIWFGLGTTRAKIFGASWG